MGHDEHDDLNDDTAPATLRLHTMPGHQVMELDQWQSSGEEEEGPYTVGADLQSLLDRAKDMLLSPTPDQPASAPSDDGEFFRSSDTLALLECDNDGVYDEDVPDVTLLRSLMGKEAAPDAEKRKAAAAGSSVSPLSWKREKASRYERKRRGRINRRMKTLGELVPNTRINDSKECLLDKAIEHIKRLQAQSQIMKNMGGGGGGVPYMIVPQPSSFPMVGMVGSSGGAAHLGVLGPMPFAGSFTSTGSAGSFDPVFQEQMAVMDMEEYHRMMASIYHGQRIQGNWVDNKPTFQ